MGVTGEVGLFLQGSEKKSAPLLKQEFSYCRILSQSDRPVVCTSGFGTFPEKVQQVSANRPIGLIG